MWKTEQDCPSLLCMQVKILKVYEDNTDLDLESGERVKISTATNGAACGYSMKKGEKHIIFVRATGEDKKLAKSVRFYCYEGLFSHSCIQLLSLRFEMSSCSLQSCCIDVLGTAACLFYLHESTKSRLPGIPEGHMNSTTRLIRSELFVASGALWTQRLSPWGQCLWPQ